MDVLYRDVLNNVKISFTKTAIAIPVWEVALRVVIKLFENGQLKAQILTRKNSIIAKPECKQHRFQSLHNMQPIF